MHYGEGAFWKPLFEEDVTMLQVAQGCSHNQCRFCDMYHKPFAPSPLEEVKADIDEIARFYLKQPRRLFLTGGNALCLPMPMLAEIVGHIGSALPDVESIGCFARITDVARKTDEDLKTLADAGLDMISIGAESGLDEALAQQHKGFSSADIVEQCARLDQAGISYALFYLAGIAGKGRGIENARATAEVFGAVNPATIMVHTMCPFEGTGLSEDIAQGRFAFATEKEIQQELREFYALFPKRVYVLSAHQSNTVPFNGYIPDQLDEVLELMDARIARDDEDRLATLRGSLKSI